MKKTIFIYIILICIIFLLPQLAEAQCSICTKTTQQLGEKPAKGLNSGILYLAATPLTIVGIIAFRWWRQNKNAE